MIVRPEGTSPPTRTFVSSTSRVLRNPRHRTCPLPTHFPSLPTLRPTRARYSSVTPRPRAVIYAALGRWQSSNESMTEVFNMILITTATR